MTKVLFAGLGGFAGAAGRYLLGLALAPVFSGLIPATLVINIAGSLVIGAVSELSLKILPLHPDLFIFLTVGLCGGFTTFSTFSFETAALLEKGRLTAALLYAAACVLLCTAGVFAGKALVRLIAAA